MRRGCLIVGAMTLALAGEARAAGFSTASLDTVLLRHLHEGRVDYGALARDRAPLDRFLVAARVADPSSWSREDQIAFWVNVYNARVLEGVIRRPGLQSVLEVGKKPGAATPGFFQDRAMSGGQDLSLDDIEHEILRKGFREPRVHFVLNCASQSCPVLPARALNGATLDSTLDLATRAFLRDRARNQIRPGHELRLSAIFQWYRSDFDDVPGGVRGFLARHWEGGEPLRGDEPIHHLVYDWSLNGRW